MDRKTMRARLLRERADLEGTVERIRERLAVPQRDSGGDLSLVDQHPADAASETEARELAVARQTMFEEKIALIDEALARLERGEYGRCVVMRPAHSRRASRARARNAVLRRGRRAGAAALRTPRPGTMTA